MVQGVRQLKDKPQTGLVLLETAPVYQRIDVPA